MARQLLALLAAVALLASASIAAADLVDSGAGSHDRALTDTPDCTTTTTGCQCIPFWTNAFDVESTNNCAAPPDDPWQPWCIVQGACKDNRWGYCDRRCLDNPPPQDTQVPAWLVDLSMECMLPLDDPTRPDLTSGIKFTMFGEADYFKRSCDLALLCSEQGVCNLPEGLTCYDYWNQTMGSFVARPTDITLLWARHGDDFRTLHQFIINVKCGKTETCVARDYGAGFMGATLTSPDACPTNQLPEATTVSIGDAYES